MIVDLTMLANLPVVVVPDEGHEQTPASASAKTSRKAPARPAPKRNAHKAPASRREREAPEQEEAGEEDRG